MKNLWMAAILAFGVLPAVAQETYENAKIVGEDLNGTARYVGMGGAMDALGADISTIGSNPAGIGLFRRSMANLSFGLVSQQDAPSFSEGNATNMSFDQVGFVYSMRNGSQSYVNFAFNYHKSRNFDYILSAAGKYENGAQNKATYLKQKQGKLFPAWPSGVPDFDKSYVSCNQLDYIYANYLNYDADANVWYGYPADGYDMRRAHSGYVGEYDFNISGNVNDRFYWGVTLGIHDVNYRHYGEYYEDGTDILVADERKIEGSGFDVKAGVIIRPVETSPFRLGLSVASPTWYDLTTSNYTVASSNGVTVPGGESYDFKLYTPWKFGLSLGHTIGNYLALGAGYEFADYGSLDTRYNTGEYYDRWYDEFYETSESDKVMNCHTKQTLKGVSTLKLGMECKATPELAIRVGYNYVSPMYKDNGFKDGTLESEGSYYSSATDYTNWKSTNRLTCGVGYTTGPVSLDLAYQYSSTNGDFYPFTSVVDTAQPEDSNLCKAVDVSNKRHQVLFTLGYKF